MSCEDRDRLLDAAQRISTEIQESVGCNNPGYVKALCEERKCIQELLEKVVDVDGDDNQDFDVTSRAIC